ncbi:AarF/UbiB family protein, partial [uncultured Clostridium sp.]
MEGNSVNRFKEILKVFTNYGLGYLLGKKEDKIKNSPANLRKAFEELGPTFIKIGQILSTRPELVNEEYIAELSKLQDNVPAEDFEKMAEVFYKEFSKKIEDEFLFIDKTPIASASIAQAYRGILKSGEDVVIKIQRPNIK